MIRLVYFSTASAPVGPGDLDAILMESRRNNAAVGVTGLLCHLDGSFLQFLEGETGDVWRTFDRISKDARHHGVLKVFDGPIGRRAFGDWSMGLVRRDEVDAAHAALAQNLRTVEIPADAENREEMAGFLDAFRRWLR